MKQAAIAAIEAISSRKPVSVGDVAHKAGNRLFDYRCGKATKKDAISTTLDAAGVKYVE